MERLLPPCYLAGDCAGQCLKPGQLLFFMFRLLQNRWNLSSCSVIMNTVTKRKAINGFAFQIKNQHQQTVHLQSLWKAVLFYSKYCNCSLNLHSNKYWKPVTLKDRNAPFITEKKKKKVKFLGIVNILWSIKYLKEVSWEILSQDLTFRKHEVFHMVHNPKDFTSYDSKILYHINKGHLKRPLKITCQ